MTITDSSAYVGRDTDERSWPWWAMLVLLPLAAAYGVWTTLRGR